MGEGCTVLQDGYVKRGCTLSSDVLPFVAVLFRIFDVSSPSLEQSATGSDVQPVERRVFSLLEY